MDTAGVADCVPRECPMTGLSGSAMEPSRMGAADLEGPTICVPEGVTRENRELPLSFLPELRSGHADEPRLPVAAGTCSSDADRRTGVASLDCDQPAFEASAPVGKLRRAEEDTGVA